MILLDLSRMMIAGIIQQSKGGGIDPALSRHFVFNMLQFINKQHRQEYGQLVLAVDDRNYWRRDIFPYYKAGRKEGREKSNIDWKKLFEVTDGIKEDLKENFPYTFAQIPRAEADDVIGAVCHHYGVDFGPADEKILIVAADGDFHQLLRYSNVHQWDAHNKKFVTYQPDSLFLKIVKGDKGDGIPSILEADTFFVNPDKKRATPVTAKVIEDARNNREKYARNFSRNEQLIDLSFIPEDIKANIIKRVEEGPDVKDRRLLPNYFAKWKLRKLFDEIHSF